MGLDGVEVEGELLDCGAVLAGCVDSMSTQCCMRLSSAPSVSSRSFPSSSSSYRWRSCRTARNSRVDSKSSSVGGLSLMGSLTP